MYFITEKNGSSITEGIITEKNNIFTKCEVKKRGGLSW